MAATPRAGVEMGTVTVVGGQARRRWGVVAAAALGLAAVPGVISAVPAHAPAVDLARIRASVGHPYQGYAVSSGTAGLPALPQLSDVSDLLDGDTRMRVWYSSADRWRVDVIDTATERDTYRTPQGEVTWDYGRRQLVDVGGFPVIRLPRGADLTPPELAKRLMSLAGDDVRLTICIGIATSNKCSYHSNNNKPFRHFEIERWETTSARFYAVFRFTA